MADLYEHQGKALFASVGVPVPRGTLVRSAAEAQHTAGRLGFPLVVKAQALSGGRGKAGGVRRVDDPGELQMVVDEVARLRIRGMPVVSLLLEEALDVAREFYLAVALDRAAGRPVLLFSRDGGVDVELSFGERTGHMLRVPVDPLLGLRDFHVRAVISASGLGGPLAQSLARTVRLVWGLYVEQDATLVEINPLAVVRSGDPDAGERLLVAADAKVTLDDNARFRRRAFSRRATTVTAEERARDAGFSYVRLDGAVGVIGNGAGLVMTLIDLLAEAGGTAADFLDIGGGASRERIAEAFDILFTDDRVKTVLLVVFGGITRCDEVARGLIAALDARPSAPALVVQLSGTNAAEGAALLAERADPRIMPAGSLREAVERAVAADRPAAPTRGDTPADPVEVR